MTRNILGTAFLHSCKVDKTNDGGDAVVISEQVYYDDGSIEPRLRTFKNPKRSFYIAKPQFRNYTEKRELEDLDRLDRHIVTGSEMTEEIYKALNGKRPFGYVNQRDLFNSPYLYGADIDIQTLFKNKYQKDFTKTKLTLKPATTGFFDIEKSVAEGTEGEITLISVTHENKIYTAIHEGFFFKIVDGKRVKGDLNELAQLSQSILSPVVDSIVSGNKSLNGYKHLLPFKFFYYVGKNAADMIKWIFDRIHENKTSFLGVWNIDYDIPNILKALDQHGISHHEIFCPPDLEKDLRVVRYQEDVSKTEDKSKKIDYSLKWHWLHTTGYTQFYDAMCLYRRLRIDKGMEPGGYSLNNVLINNKMEGKLYFPELKDVEGLSKAQWHIQMEAKHFYHYVVYNQADVLLIQLMEWQNGDVQSMTQLATDSVIAKFHRQTRRVTDTIYFNMFDEGKVLGTAGSNMITPHDAEIIAIGGAVLDPNRMDMAGLKIFEEYPNLRSQFHSHVNDIDFTGFYPSATQGANISKETKLSTALYITGDHVQKHHTPRSAVEVFFSYLVNPEDNAISLGTEFLNLPSFDEMDQLFQSSEEALSHLDVV